jgi:hypothetical protein
MNALADALGLSTRPLSARILVNRIEAMRSALADACECELVDMTRPAWVPARRKRNGKFQT